MMNNELDKKWLEDIRETMSDYREELPSDDWSAIVSELDAKACPRAEVRSGGRIVRMLSRVALAAACLTAFSVLCYMPSAYERLNMPDSVTEETLGERLSEMYGKGEVEKSMEMASVGNVGGVEYKKVASRVGKNRNEENIGKESVGDEKVIDLKGDEECEVKEVVDGGWVDNVETVNDDVEVGNIVTGDDRSVEGVNMQEVNVASVEKLDINGMEENRDKKNGSLVYVPDGKGTKENRVKLARVIPSSEKRWGVGVHFGGNGLVESASDLAPYENAKVDVGGGLSSTIEGRDSIYLPSEEGEFYKPSVDVDSKSDGVISVDNHMSLGFGVSVGKRIIDMLSVETGLTYTQLKADADIRNIGVVEQKIQYIGIPLRVHYDIVEWNRVSLYGAGGPSVNFCVSAKRGDENLDMKKVKMSLAGVAGVQFMIGRYLGLYVEPGVVCYMGDDNGVETMWTKNKCMFSSQFGIRISY